MNTRSNGKRAFRGLAALGVILAAAAMGFLGTPAARAQTNGGITLNLQNAPIQNVLRQLFQSAGKSFTIDPNVTGTVTVDVNGVTFDQALNAVLAGSYPPLQATPNDGGIYQVSVKQAAPPASPTPGGPGRFGQPPTTTTTSTTEPQHFYAPIKINHYDAYDMALLVAAFTPTPSAPVWVPADPPVQQSQNSNGGGNRGGIGGGMGGIGGGIGGIGGGLGGIGGGMGGIGGGIGGIGGGLGGIGGGIGGIGGGIGGIGGGIGGIGGGIGGGFGGIGGIGGGGIL